jgi:hypothetical protein
VVFGRRSGSHADQQYFNPFPQLCLYKATESNLRDSDSETRDCAERFEDGLFSGYFGVPISAAAWDPAAMIPRMADGPERGFSPVGNSTLAVLINAPRTPHIPATECPAMKIAFCRKTGLLGVVAAGLLLLKADLVAASPSDDQSTPAHSKSRIISGLDCIKNPLNRRHGGVYRV